MVVCPARLPDIQDSPFHPFNSFKILLWRQHLEGMATGKLLPPVTVDFDPTNKCNSDCIWCNSRGFRRENQDSMTPEHMIELVEFLAKWGVKSCCVAGGGESLLNPGTADLLIKAKKVGVKTGLITNGIKVTEEQMEAIVDSSSWCGFSIDAGNRKSFKDVHQVDRFYDVIENLRQLVNLRNEKKSKLQITYKFLLHPLNANSILSAARLAKGIGVDLFQARPVCWDNLYGQPRREPIDYSSVVNIINEQMEEASKLTDKNFRFFGIRHKFGDTFERKIEFTKCRATPIMAVYCADGTVQMCHDNRGKKDWILCRHDNPEDILKVWGRKKHLDMIDSIIPSQCPRCTFSRYNEIIENVILEDKMCRDFP